VFYFDTFLSKFNPHRKGTEDAKKSVFCLAVERNGKIKALGKKPSSKSQSCAFQLSDLSAES
jgi:hypothetical protein